MAKVTGNVDEVNDKIAELVRKKRKGQADRQGHHPEKATKFVIEYRDANKEVVSKWHYDLKKNPNGPIMVEDFDIPPKEKKSKK